MFSIGMIAILEEKSLTYAQSTSHSRVIAARLGREILIKLMIL